MGAKDYRTAKKLQAGPGGWACPCCNPYGTAPGQRGYSKAKKASRRLARRIAKAKIREES